jgi:hypothetical protein
MEFHEVSFSLPKDAVLLVQGEQCPNQCFRVGHNAYGFQFHLEADGVILEQWFDAFQKGRIDTYAKYLRQFSPAFFEKMRSNLPLLIQNSGDFCIKVARNWLQLPSASTS